MQLNAAMANQKATVHKPLCGDSAIKKCELTLGESIPEVINYDEICHMFSHLCSEPFSKDWLPAMFGRSPQDMKKDSDVIRTNYGALNLGVKSLKGLFDM